MCLLPTEVTGLHSALRQMAGNTTTFSIPTPTSVNILAVICAMQFTVLGTGSFIIHLLGQFEQAASRSVEVHVHTAN